jgi:hypothetical protein
MATACACSPSGWRFNHLTQRLGADLAVPGAPPCPTAKHNLDDALAIRPPRPTIIRRDLDRQPRGGLLMSQRARARITFSCCLNRTIPRILSIVKQRTSELLFHKVQSSEDGVTNRVHDIGSARLHHGFWVVLFEAARPFTGQDSQSEPAKISSQLAVLSSLITRGVLGTVG